jgi:hypothetical protein
MAAKVGFYNFSWRDMGVPTLEIMMDIVQVPCLSFFLYYFLSCAGAVLLAVISSWDVTAFLLHQLQLLLQFCWCHLHICDAVVIMIRKSIGTYLASQTAHV